MMIWTRRRLVALLGAACMAACVGCEIETTDKDIRQVPLNELRRLIQEQDDSTGRNILLLLDPRSKEAYQEAHLPGARRVEMPDLLVRGEPNPALEGYEHTVIYGNDPASPIARAVTKRMIEYGFSGVRMFFDGVNGWRSAGYPVEGEASQPPSAAE